MKFKEIAFAAREEQRSTKHRKFLQTHFFFSFVKFEMLVFGWGLIPFTPSSQTSPLGLPSNRCEKSLKQTNISDLSWARLNMHKKTSFKSVSSHNFEKWPKKTVGQKAKDREKKTAKKWAILFSWEPAHMIAYLQQFKDYTFKGRTLPVHFHKDLI